MLFWASKFVVLCYSSNRNLRQGTRVQDTGNYVKEFWFGSIGLKAYCCLRVMYAKHMSSKVRLCGFEYQPCQWPALLGRCFNFSKLKYFHLWNGEITVLISLGWCRIKWDDVCRVFCTAQARKAIVSLTCFVNLDKMVSHMEPSSLHLPRGGSTKPPASIPQNNKWILW